MRLFLGGLLALNIFNIGLFEILVIVVVGLVLFGPAKFINLAESLRKAFNEFQAAFTGMADVAVSERLDLERSPSEERAQFVLEDNDSVQIDNIVDGTTKDSN